MTPAATDLLAGAVITTLFLGIVAIAEAWSRLGNPNPEWTRKLIHVAGGLVALSLPFVIQSYLVVLVMAVGMATLFFAGKLTGTLRSLHSVERKSSGTEYYPFVIYALFYFTQGTAWKYVICVLVLSTADAAAALVGSRFGRLRYEVDKNYKSLEGSLTFLVITFLAVFLPLATWPMDDRPPIASCSLTALLIAMLTTGFEAISQGGRDNVWVPLGTLIILNLTLPLPVNELSRMVLVLFAIYAVAGLVAWRSATFNVGGTLVLTLAAYGCWTLASLDWAIPVFLAFAFYVSAVVVSPRHIVIASKPVLKALLLPFSLVACAFLLSYYDAATEYRSLFGPFLAGCVTITAQSAWDQVLRERKLDPFTKLIGSTAITCLACLVVALPTYLLQSEISEVSLFWVFASALAVGIPSGMLSAHKVLAESGRKWWVARMFSIIAAMGLVALIQVAGLSPLWNPR